MPKLSDILAHVCPTCGAYKPRGVSLCDACERDRYVESKRVSEWQRESCARLDMWEEA